MILVCDNHIITNDVRELACVKVSDRRTNTESSKEKCDGTADTKNSHEHPLLVAENITGSDFLCKAHPVPKRGDALQKNLRT